MMEANMHAGEGVRNLAVPPRSPFATRARDLLVLSKARVVSMLVFTAAVGEVLAPGFRQHWLAALAGLAGIAFAGGAGGVINQLVEPDLDQHMRRTHRRPLVDGRISRAQGMAFAAFLMVLSIAVLAWGTNMRTLVLTLGGTVGYGVVYTLYLKPATPWNIVWGGLAGALPPLIGWVAVSDRIEAMPLWLVALVFTWTPAHFWPLAISCREDYAKACIPMLPVTHGVERTRREVVRYALATLLVSLVPAYLAHDWIYGAAATVTGVWYLAMTMRLRRMSEGAAMDRYARRVFGMSISYLFILFAALVLGHFVQMAGLSKI
ncbi:MAG: heme o synthase [Gammaproteobacteria bacterium]|nr:heme o synthase [Gammaproteobacteria bacterium]